MVTPDLRSAAVGELSDGGELMRGTERLFQSFRTFSTGVSTLAGAAVLAGAVMLSGLTAERADAQQVQSIAALVNDKVISAYDLEQRVRLVVSTSGLEATPETLKRIREQVLRTLVDEELQLQEAEKDKIKIPDEEINLAIARLAQRNGMTRPQILQILAESGVSENTLRRQIKASMAWDTLTQRRFSSRISVTEEDINQQMEQLQANADEPQYWVLEIFMGFESPEEEKSVARTAERLVEDLRTGQASFSSLARQFSQSASASAGGDIGWVTKEDLPPEIGRVINTMRKGALSIPLRTVNGYYIIALRDKRIGIGAPPEQTKLKLKQVVVPALPDFPEKFLRMAGGIAGQITQQAPSCDEVEVVARSVPNGRSSDLGTRRVSELTEQFQEAVAGLSKGDVTPPVRSEAGFHVLFVCDREIEGSMMPPREAIEDRIFQQELSMVQRRFLRDLRRDATVEIR